MHGVFTEIYNDTRIFDHYRLTKLLRRYAHEQPSNLCATLSLHVQPPCSTRSSSFVNPTTRPFTSPSNVTNRSLCSLRFTLSLSGTSFRFHAVNVIPAVSPALTFLFVRPSHHLPLLTDPLIIHNSLTLIPAQLNTYLLPLLQIIPTIDSSPL